MVISDAEMLFRMGLGTFLGAVIGYERERTGRPAGLRTHLLVALASTTFMLVSTQFTYYQNYGDKDLIAVDTSRIAASVVSGVGFLGAGAILRTGMSVHGLTTAASLWLTSALGLAAGGGMVLVACSATVLSLVGLVALRRVEGKNWRTVRRHLTIVRQNDGLGREELMNHLLQLGAVTVDEVEYEFLVQKELSRFKVDVRLPSQQALEQFLSQLRLLQGVRRVKVHRQG